jgi:hypothetical protein
MIAVTALKLQANNVGSSEVEDSEWD